MLLRLAIAWAGVLLVGCGGGGGGSSPSSPGTPTAPPFPAGTVLTFVSGETNAPVGGATVTVGTATYTSNEAGKITLGETASSGVTLTVLAAGFLDRRTLLRSAEETAFSLWPRSSRTGFDEAWARQLVYTAGALCCPGTTQDLGQAWLRRIRSGTSIPLTIAAGTALQRDTVQRAAREAADLVNVANEGRVVFQFSPAPSSGPAIEIRFDPTVCGAGPPAACMAVDLDSAGYITGGRLVFPADPPQTSWWAQAASRSYFPGEEGYFHEVIAHELAHAVGLQHSLASASDWGRIGMMAVDASGGYGLAYFFYYRDFAPAEKLAMKLMYQRRAGNRFPDDETGVRASTAPGSLVVCRLPHP